MMVSRVASFFRATFRRVKSLFLRLWVRGPGNDADTSRRRGPDGNPTGEEESEFTTVPEAGIHASWSAVTLPELFERPHPHTSAVQERVAKALFQLAGLNYLPGRLRAQLKHVDAFQAVDRFFRSIGLTYSEILADSETRALLELALGILAEVDFLRRQAGLSDRPVYLAIKNRDAADLEALGRRLERISRVVLGDPDLEIVFPEAETRLKPTRDSIVREWWTTPEEVVEGFLKERDQWQAQQKEFDSNRKSVSQLLAQLESAAGQLGDNDLRRKTGSFQARERAIHTAARDGALDAQAATRGMQELLEEVERAAKAAGQQRRAHREGSGTSSEEVCLRMRLVTLELEYPAGLDRGKIRTAFRRLSQIHHPDVGGTNDAMRHLLQARAALLDYLETGICR